MEDAELVKLACQDNESAFEQLMARLQPAVESTILGYLDSFDAVQDAVQETFLRMHQGLPGLRDPSKLGPWVISIARHTALNVRKHNSRRREISLLNISADNLCAPVSGSQVSSELEAALDELEPRMRQLLLLHYFDEYSIAEIGVLTTCSEGSAKRLLWEARQQLKNSLQAAGMKVRLAENASKLRRKVMEAAPVVRFTNVLLLTAAIENASSISLDPRDGQIRLSFASDKPTIEVPAASPQLCQATCDRLFELGEGKTVSLTISGKAYEITVRRESDGRTSVDLNAA